MAKFVTPSAPNVVAMGVYFVPIRYRFHMRQLDQSSALQCIVCGELAAAPYVRVKQSFFSFAIGISSTAGWLDTDEVIIGHKACLRSAPETSPTHPDNPWNAS